MSEMMVGRKVNFNVEKQPAQPKDVMLDVRNLSVAKKGHQDVVKNVSFQVHEGEIVCIAGIDGNGQTELVHAVTGLGETAGGRILINGRGCDEKEHTRPQYRRTQPYTGGPSQAWPGAGL